MTLISNPDVELFAQTFHACFPRANPTAREIEVAYLYTVTPEATYEKIANLLVITNAGARWHAVKLANKCGVIASMMMWVLASRYWQAKGKIECMTPPTIPQRVPNSRAVLLVASRPALRL